MKGKSGFQLVDFQLDIETHMNENISDDFYNAFKGDFIFLFEYLDELGEENENRFGFIQNRVLDYVKRHRKGKRNK